MRAVAGFLVLSALALAGCGADSESTARSGDGGSALPSSREQAPAVSGTTLEGEALALSDLAGKAVVVNVWASW